MAAGTVKLEFADYKVKLRTDNQGEASFDFPPLPSSLIDKEKGTDVRLEIQATVTDTAALPSPL